MFSTIASEPVGAYLNASSNAAAAARLNSEACYSNAFFTSALVSAAVS